MFSFWKAREIHPYFLFYCQAMVMVTGLIAFENLAQSDLQMCTHQRIGTYSTSLMGIPPWGIHLWGISPWGISLWGISLWGTSQ